MRHRNRTALFVLVAIVLSACGTMTTTTPTIVAYRTIAGVKATVDLGMKIWADRGVTGKTTPQQEAQVSAAFDKYTAAARTAAAIYRASTDPAPPNLTAAADALLALLSSFGVEVK